MMLANQSPEVWRRALHRAEARGISVDRKGSDGGRTWYAVQSFSRSEVRHGVLVEVKPEGIDVLCSCEAGQAERVCQHAAAVLRHAGLLPDACLEPLPAPTPIRRVMTVNDYFALEDA